jgi:hypothetical protein
MIALKDFLDIDGYTYKVCEELSCEGEACEIYEGTGLERPIDVCEKHYKELDSNRYLW